MRPISETDEQDETGRVMANGPSPMSGCQNSSTPGAVAPPAAADTMLTGYSFVGFGASEDAAAHGSSPCGVGPRRSAVAGRSQPPAARERAPPDSQWVPYRNQIR